MYNIITVKGGEQRPGSWAYGAKAAKKAFAQIASVISESEQVYMIVSEGTNKKQADYT